MADVIFDTKINVPVVANGLAEQASAACEEACIDRLLAGQDHDVVLIDERGLIFRRRFSSGCQRSRYGRH
jgi:hypothetical protein